MIADGESNQTHYVLNWETAQAMNTSENHVQKLAENEQIREMTVEEVAAVIFSKPFIPLT